MEPVAHDGSLSLGSCGDGLAMQSSLSSEVVMVPDAGVIDVGLAFSDGWGFLRWRGGKTRWAADAAYVMWVLSNHAHANVASFELLCMFVLLRRASCVRSFHT